MANAAWRSVHPSSAAVSAVACVGEPHAVAQLGVEALLLPPELLDVLAPLEVRPGHAAGVGEHVGDDGDAPVAQHLVAVGGHGVVGGLQHDRGLDLGGVVAPDDLAERGRDEDVARAGEQLVVLDALDAGLRGVADRAAGRDDRDERGDVEARRRGARRRGRRTPPRRCSPGRPPPAPPTSPRCRTPGWRGAGPRGRGPGARHAPRARRPRPARWPPRAPARRRGRPASR